jgi:hypothetical protein
MPLPSYSSAPHHQHHDGDATDWNHQHQITDGNLLPQLLSTVLYRLCSRSWLHAVRGELCCGGTVT